MQPPFLAGLILVAFSVAPAFAAAPASQPSTRPAVTQLQVPKVPGPNSRYWLASNLTGLYTMGFAEFELNERMGMQNAWGIGSTETETAHFRLSGGRHAIGLFDGEHAYSLVLVYTSPSESKPLKFSTKDGSLEAWLVRRKIEQRHTPPVDEWVRFLETSNEEKLKMPNVFRLVGTGTMKEDEHGLLKRLDLDVSSVKPLPIFKEWLDDAEKQARHWNDEQGRIWLMAIQYYRTHPATKPAKISGDVVAGWGPPRSGILSSK